MTDRKIYNPVQRDSVTFLKTSKETGGAYTLVDVELAADGGVGLHYHKTYSEKFTVITGTLGVMLGKQDQHLKKNESATAEPNILHRFYNSSSEPVRFQVELRPASEGFERSLQVAYGLARDGKTNSKGIPLNIFHVALLLMAKIARTVGADKKLHRYYLTN